MSTLAKLLVNLGLDSSEYSSGIQKVENQTKGLGGVLKIAAGTAIGFVGAVAGIAAASGVFGFIKDAAVGMNATLENSTLQFTTLTGNADFAAEHVKALFVLGGATPFETQSLINASATMETFGGSTLNTIANLKLFGDAAAATNAAGSDIGQHLEEISYWSSRMNASLASGRPVLETANALQRLGVISPDTMNKLMAMEQAGASGAAMWAVYQQGLTRFTGAMALQSQTWSGLMSSISDNARMVVATAFKPLFEEGKKALGGLLTFLNNLAASGAAERFANGLRFVIAVLVEFGGRFIAYAKMAFAWGSNIAAQFAAGIASAINVIIGVMQQIGSVISSWLSPGSPPKITPDLDKWGAEAATIYFEGWAKGDISAFKSMASTLKSTLDGLVDVGKFGKEGVIPAVLAGRAGLSKVFSELATLGEVSQKTFDDVVASMGPAGAQIGSLIRAYSNLSRATRAVDSAQSELNATTDKYAQMLAPLSAEMKALQDREKEIKDMQRIDELNASLADGSLDAAEQELARNEIAQINLQKQIKGVEEEKDAVVGVAQAKLDAAKIEQQNAQTQVENQQQAIDHQNETNQLIGQQLALVEQMAKAAASAAAGAKGGGVGAGGGLAETMNAAIAPVKGVSTALAAAQIKFDETAAKATAFVDGIKTGITNATSTLSVGAASVVAFFGGFSQFAPVVNSTIARLQLMQTVVMTVFGALAGVVSANSAAIVTNVQTTWATLVATVNSVVTSLNGIIVLVLNQILTFVQSNGVGIAQSFVGWTTQVISIVGTALQLLSGIVLGLYAVILQFTQEHGAAIQTVLGGAWAIVSNIISGALSIISGLLTAALQIFQGNWAGAWKTIQSMSVSVLGNIVGVITGALNIIAGFFGTSLSGIVSLWQNNFNMLITIAAKIAANIITVLMKMGSDAVKAGKAIIDGIKKGINDAWDALKSWFVDKIKSLLPAGMAGIAASSPSKDFADQLGNTAIMGGILLGMEQGLPRLLAFIGKAGRKILSETLGVMASMTRSSGIDVFRSLLDIQKVPTFQPLVDSTKAFQDAQTDASETAEKLLEINEQAADMQAKINAAKLVADNAQTYQDEVKANEKLAKLYEDQKELLKEQADLVALQVEQKKAIWDIGVAVHAAEATSNEQANAINTIAVNARKAYEDAQKQALEMMKIDAKGALEFFNQRKAQIEELAALEKERALATTDQQRADLDTQIALVGAAQAAEQAKQAVDIYIGQQGGGGVYGDRDIIKIIENALRNAGIQVDILNRTT